MHNLAELGVRLERSIPNAQQGSVRNAVAAFHESVAMLMMYSRALELVGLLDVGGDSAPSVAAFGSVGRLDGSIQLSDYDVMFLYPGEANAVMVTRLREAVTEVVSSNRAFPCDHRSEIEARTFSFDTSPAYPILSEGELWSMDAEPRALQMLTEGRVIRGRDLVSRQATRLLTERYGFTDDVHSLDLRSLRDGLARLKTSYCTDVYARVRKLPEPLKNRKVLKLFALREFHYLSTLLAVAEAALAVRVRTDGGAVERAAGLLASPSFLKVASFADPTGTVVCALLRSQSLSEECGRCLAQHAGGTAATGTTPLPSGQGHTDPIGSLVLAILRPYDRLLGMLHDRAFIRSIDDREPNVTDWLIDPLLRSLLQARSDLLAGASRLAHALLDVLGILEQELGCRALDEAKAALEVVRTYRLEMDAPAL